MARRPALLSHRAAGFCGPLEHNWVAAKTLASRERHMINTNARTATERASVATCPCLGFYVILLSVFNNILCFSSHIFVISYASCMVAYRRLVVKTGAERRPPPGIQAQHPAPAPHASHARHDRSMARKILVARPNLGGLHSSPRAFTKIRPELWASCGCTFVHFSKEK